MIVRRWPLFLVALSLMSCEVSNQPIGDDTVEFAPGEIVGVCIPNDAGVDGGIYHLSPERFRECFSSPEAVFAPDCPFAQCLAFIDEVCSKAEAEGKQALGCAL